MERGLRDNDRYVQERILFIEHKIRENCYVAESKLEMGLGGSEEKVARFRGCFARRKLSFDGIDPVL